MPVALSSAYMEFPAVAFAVICHAAVAVVVSWVPTATGVVVLTAVLVFVKADGIYPSLKADALTLTLLADDTFMALAAFPETLSFFPTSVVELSSVAIAVLVL